MRFLNSEHYYGVDLNSSLEVGLNIEIANFDLSNKVDGQNFSTAPGFKYSEEWPVMDMALAFSLFTHLYYDSICRCLKKRRKC